ncbi:MAG: ribbon-helix-helix domain-containing protein [Alphaproteobacteria bacterium]|nr:ribbon-helix-helix domain-containing protein [Alphaproteobacteria bacterium]
MRSETSKAGAASDGCYKFQPGQSSLISRNVTIFGRRTSVRLEPEMWTALNDIADREKCSVHDICSLVYVRKSSLTSLTAAIRVFLMLYYKAAATDIGHKDAGHGDFSVMKRRARIPATYKSYFEKKEAKFRQQKRKTVGGYTN